MFKSIRKRDGGTVPDSAGGASSASSSTAASRASASSSYSSRADELGMSVPYERLGPGGKVVALGAGQQGPNGRIISSPNTNPTLTADGTDLNIHVSQLPTRRDSERSNVSRTRQISLIDDDASSSYQTTTDVSRALSSASTASSYRTAGSLSSRQPLTSTTGGGGSSPYPRAYSPAPSSYSEYAAGGGGGTPTPSTLHRGPSSGGGLPVTPVARSGAHLSSSRHVRNSSASTGASSRYGPGVGGGGGGDPGTPSGGGGGAGGGSETPGGSFVSDEFYFPRPSKEEVDRLFAGLISNRESSSPTSSTGTPASVRPEMRALPDDNKWLMVLNDARIKWQQERDRAKRESAAKEMGRDSKSLYGRDSPEWYIQKFMDGTITGKNVASLSVSLRTLPVSWFRSFIEMQGQSVLSDTLGKINHKESKKAVEIDLEYEIIKCLKILLNSKHGANDAINHPHIITHIACSLSSPNLSTRKLVADILTFLCYWDKPRGHEFVLHGLKVLQQLHQGAGRFDAWFQVFEATIDGRGRMGSLVGVSEDLRTGLGSAVTSVGEGGLNDYAMANLFLIHALTTVIDDADGLAVRVHLRAQMEACGVKRIIAKLKDFGHSSMDRLIRTVENEEEEDAREVAKEFNQGLLRDMSSPAEVFAAILESIQGTRAADFFLSAMQHLLLIREDDETRTRYFQLVDQLITSVVLDRKVGTSEQDFSSLMGVSVQKVVSRFADQDRLDKALAQAAEMRATAQQLALEKAAVEEELASQGGGVVRQLQEKLASSEDALKNSRLATHRLEEELVEVKRMYEERIKSLELRIQELFNMLRESRDLEGITNRLRSRSDMTGEASAVDRQELIDNLERQHELQKTIEKLEGVSGRRRKQLPPSKFSDEDEDEEIDEDEDGDEVARVKIASATGPLPKAKGRNVDRAEVKSGSQFIDAEDEIVREHIEASLAAGLEQLNSPGSAPAIRSARAMDPRRFPPNGRTHTLFSDKRGQLPPRFLEELHGRRFSRSASAPTLGGSDSSSSAAPFGGAVVDDVSDSERTDPRTSGFTVRTEDTQGTSIASQDRRSILSNNDSFRISRSPSTHNISLAEYAKSRSGKASNAGAGAGGSTLSEDTSALPLATLSEDKELELHNRDDDESSSSDTSGFEHSPTPGERKRSSSSASRQLLQQKSVAGGGGTGSADSGAALGGPGGPMRPPNPFASVLAQINAKKSISDDDDDDDDDLAPPAGPALPFNPMMAALHAQIKSKGPMAVSEEDDKVDKGDSKKLTPKLGPPRPAFLGDISKGFQKRAAATSAEGAAVGKSESTAVVASSSSGPPRPAFLGSIAGGMSNLKGSGSSSAASSTRGSAHRSLVGTPPGTPGLDGLLGDASASKVPRKVVAYKASARVKQLHWDKFGELNPEEGTIWNVSSTEVQENEWAEKLKQMNIWNQMEATFSAQAAKMQIEKQKQVELMSVLDPKVKRMVEIFMKGFKIEDPQEITEKILSCDEKYCTQIFLENMQKFLPSPEQVGKLNAHKTDTVAELMLLHPADRLMVHLIKIPRLEARVTGLLYRARFEERISLFEEAVEQTTEASVALQEAPKFRQLLSLILLIGNYLNGNSYAGGAFGFKISSINKLVETKSPQGQNLLHFLERTVSNLFQEMEGFLDELDKACEGSRHELKPVGEGVTDLSKKLVEIDREIKSHLLDEAVPGDRYSQRMLRSLADARERVEALNDKRIAAEATYNAVLKYFGEDPATASNVFFGIFKTFVTSYKQCQKQNLTWAEMEAAKQRRKEAADTRAREKAERDAKIDEAAPVMDNIMDSLKNMQPRRPRRAGRGRNVSVSISTLPSLPPLGSEAPGSDFGGQAMSILNTLRSRGFGSLPKPEESLEERASPISTQAEAETELAEEGDTSVTKTEESSAPVPVEASERVAAEGEEPATSMVEDALEASPGNPANEDKPHDEE